MGNGWSLRGHTARLRARNSQPVTAREPRRGKRRAGSGTARPCGGGSPTDTNASQTAAARSRAAPAHGRAAGSRGGVPNGAPRPRTPSAAAPGSGTDRTRRAPRSSAPRPGSSVRRAAPSLTSGPPGRSRKHTRLAPPRPPRSAHAPRAAAQRAGIARAQLAAPPFTVQAPPLGGAKVRGT